MLMCTFSLGMATASGTMGEGEQVTTVYRYVRHVDTYRGHTEPQCREHACNISEYRTEILKYSSYASYIPLEMDEREIG